MRIDFKGLFDPDNAAKLGLLHAGLGISVFFTNVVVIAWILGVLLYSLNYLLKAKRYESWKLVAILAYISGIEILARIARTTPFVPYEFGKYAYVIFLFIGILKYRKQKFTPGLIILIFSLPGLLLIPTHSYRVFLVNSFLGIFLLGWAAILFHGKQLYEKQLKVVFLSFLYGIISVTAAVIIRTPSFDEVEFILSANRSTSGGFGSNQVSTVLGAGFLISAMSFLFRIKLFPFRFMDVGLTLMFVFRALLTFSRGGVLGGVLGVLGAYLMPGKVSVGVRKVKPIYIILLSLGMAATFYLVNQITGNTILNRYKGETYATQLGVKEVSATTLTTGRTDLMNAELQIFLESPLLGVGPGAGYEYREHYYGQHSASHTEVTRLLAEHGIPGLIMGIIFLFFPVFRVLKLKNKRERMLATAFFTLAIFTSFHAAMRTTITPFFWALGCMRFPNAALNYDKKV